MSWIIDFFTGSIMQVVWPLIAAAGGVLALWIFGAKKRAEGKRAERDRAWRAQVEANRIAEEERMKAAAKPIGKKREETEKWER